MSTTRPPPPPPWFVLRGHQHAVTAAVFYTKGAAEANGGGEAAAESSSCLISGDAGGNIKIWDLKSRRAVHTMRAHSDKGVLRIMPLTCRPASDAANVDGHGAAAEDLHAAGSTDELPAPAPAPESTPTSAPELPASAPSLLSQGRDGELCVWTGAALIAASSSPGLTATPSPAPAALEHVASQQPGGLGFCRCAAAPPPPAESDVTRWIVGAQQPAAATASRKPHSFPMTWPLLAVPGDDASAIVLHILNPQAGPEARPAATLTVPVGAKPVGMCMCVEFHWINRAKFLKACGTEHTADAGELHEGSSGSSGSSGDGAAFGGDSCLVLLAGYEDGTSILWDVASLSVLHRSTRHSEPMLCVSADPNLDLLAVSGSAGTVLTIASAWPELASCKKSARSQKVTLKHPGVNAVAFRNDFKLLATAGWDNRVRIFSWPKIKPLAILESHASAINCLAWSASLRSLGSIQLLAACSKDSRISLWSIYNE